MRTKGQGLHRILDEVVAFYGDVDAAVSRIRSRLGGMIRCRRGCSWCCIDSITVFEVEALAIARHNREVLERGTPHPDGACAFLDKEGSCRIYPHRPYVCRTQGLPLRWLEESGSGFPHEMRDICPKNLTKDGITGLDKSSCWTVGPAEERLAWLQAIASGGLPRRVTLRSLFEGVRLTSLVPCSGNDLVAVRSLLEEAGLGGMDIKRDMLRHFVAVKNGGTLIGCGGLVPLGKNGLLRSIALVETHRGSGMGTAVVQALERRARHRGITTLFLLTATAETFFRSLGYTAASPDDAPGTIGETIARGCACLEGAVFMRKDLTGESDG